MPSVVCPTCGEKGRIPSQFIGVRIKCKKCGNSFLVTPPVAKVAAEAEAVSSAQSQQPAEPKFEGIAVEELEPGAWSVASSAPVVASGEHDHPAEHEPAHDDSDPAFVATQGTDGAAVRQYKVLTEKDKWFDNKFDLVRLEEALNHYARQGWVVRSMATPHIAGFSGGPREVLVILLER